MAANLNAIPLTDGAFSALAVAADSAGDDALYVQIANAFDREQPLSMQLPKKVLAGDSRNTTAMPAAAIRPSRRSSRSRSASRTIRSAYRRARRWRVASADTSRTRRGSAGSDPRM